MADIRIPDDIERWEKKGLREDIDTDAEHVHDFYVWKNLAIEFEKWSDCEHDRGHWNPYAIVDGHPMKLSKDYFDSFDEAVGFLKACMKDKSIADKDEADDDDTDIPKHPEGDTVARKSVSMATRIAMMNGEPGAYERYKMEMEEVRKAQMGLEDFESGSDLVNRDRFKPGVSDTHLENIKQQDARDKVLQGISRPDGDPLLNSKESGKSPSELNGEEVNYPQGGKDGIPTAKVKVGSDPSATMNGADKTGGQVVNANFYGRSATGKDVSAATPGKAQDVGKMLDNMAYSDSREAKAGRETQRNLFMNLGGHSYPVTQANKFMAHSFTKPKIYLPMLNNYNRNARAMRSEMIPLLDEDRDLTSDDFGSLSSNQLRHLLLQEYKEKDPITGQLVRPKELKNTPIFGGWMLGRTGSDGQFVSPVRPDGSLNPEAFSMLSNQDDTLNGGGVGLLPNSLGIYTGKLGGDRINRPSKDISGREDELTHVLGKDRRAPNEMIFGALAQATNALNRDRSEIKDDLVERLINEKFNSDDFADGKDAEGNPITKDQLISNYLSRFMKDEGGSPILDGEGKPITEDDAKRAWAIDRIMENRRNRIADAYEPYIMHWLDNLPLSEMMGLFDKHGYLRRNMAMDDEERKQWYDDLFSQGAIRDYEYDGNALEDLQKYMGRFGFTGAGKTLQQMRDEADNDLSNGLGMTPGAGKTLVPKTGAGGSTSKNKTTKTPSKIGEEQKNHMQRVVENTLGGKKIDPMGANRLNEKKKNSSMRDRIAYFDPMFVSATNKSEEEDEIPSGKVDTNPRIASFRTVSMGEGKDPVFPMKIVDKTTGKVLVEWDGKL